MSKKFYVVWRGHQPGIYSDWPATKTQVEGFQGARYKSYSTEAEAKLAFKSGPPHPQAAPEKPKWVDFPEVDRTAIAVDAACSGNPGAMEYRGVWLATGEEWFRQGPFPNGTNNIGEYLAIVHALALMQKSGSHHLIYTDSATALAWIKAKKSKSKLERTAKTAKIWELIDRADQWVVDHNISKYQIAKWPTETWGEIPADFGRK